MKKYVLSSIAIILGILTAIALIFFMAPRVRSCRELATAEAQQELEAFKAEYFNPNLMFTPCDTSEDCLFQIKQCDTYIELLEDNLLKGHNSLIKQATVNEIRQTNAIQKQHYQEYKVLLEKEAEEAKWAARAVQYPEATYIWLYMRNNFGWSETICAGIMGNMMAEVAGGTLQYLSRWDMDEPGGLGLIQWIGERRVDIRAKYGYIPTIDEQLDFMKDELYGSNGVCKQVTDSQLLAIFEASTPERVAYNFARYFERCASFSYGIRKQYARIAYNYFVD